MDFFVFIYNPLFQLVFMAGFYFFILNQKIMTMW